MESRVYQNLWAELHDFALNATEIQWKNRYKWFRDWLKSVPNIQCGCTENFRKLLKLRPPVMSSRERFYLWSVDIHNDVNLELGKPIWQILPE